MTAHRWIGIWIGGLAGCHAEPAPTVPQPRPVARPVAPATPAMPATLRGVVRYEDGAPAGAALITLTELATEKQVAVISTDGDGRFEAPLAAGEYGLAVATEHGFRYVDPLRVPSLETKVTLSRDCRSLAGRARGSVPGTRISFTRKSRSAGDRFLGEVRGDGSFALCLPENLYGVELVGATVSPRVNLDVTSSSIRDFAIEGFATDLVTRPPGESPPIAATLDGLVADILRSDPRVIGLGEATHGTAELVSSRARLGFELIRRANVRLMLFEFDAILAMPIDDYVMGGDVDLAKAVAGLGFWTSDTYELLRFFQDLRAYNATTRDKVHVWGIDAQDTKPPASLLANERTLALSAEDKALLLEIGVQRGAPIRKLAPARRALLDSLLARLARRRTGRLADLRIALAARSLLVQVGYFDGDTGALYGVRRDAGMATLASYLVSEAARGPRAGRPVRACVWAHAGHISRVSNTGDPSLGKHLADVASHRYYPIGFYVYEGSVRAWDAAGTIGVITHPIARAASYMVEGAVMAATREPEIAWLPVRQFSPALRSWAEIPRYAREVGAVYLDAEDSLVLRAIPAEFDALVVIRAGHDSSPTPTGVRRGGD